MDEQTLSALKALLRRPGPEAVAGVRRLLGELAAQGKGPYTARTRRAGHTLLHLASRADNVDACRELLPLFCVNMGNYRGETPLFLAAAEGASAAVRFLLGEGADPCAASGSGRLPAEAAATQEIRAAIEAAAEGWPFGGPKPVGLTVREAYLFRTYMQWLMALEVAYCQGRQERPDALPAETLELFRKEGLEGLARRCRAADRRAAAARAWRAQLGPGCARCGAVAGERKLQCCGRCRGVRYCGPACQKADRARHAPGCAEMAPGCHHCGEAAVERKLKRCGRCREATYCDSTCQKAAWALHKPDCSPPDPAEAIQRLARQGSLMPLPSLAAPPPPRAGPRGPALGGSSSS